MIGHPTPRALSALLAVAACVTALTACTGRPSGDDGGAGTIIQNKGSDTMVNVAQLWAEEYKQVAPSVDVEVSGGGSGVGIAALTKGVVDIASASREMKPGEMEAARQATGAEPQEFTVGYDALAVYVHKDNPMEEITLEQLAGIYAENGTITRWSQIGVSLPGVENDTIVRVSRQSSSGTYEFFREHVLENRDFKLGSRDLNGSKEVVELVGSTPTAIGYSGMGYATEEVKMLKVAAAPGQPAFAPTVESTVAKEYPLARSLHLYTVGNPSAEIKSYVEWIRSDAGQTILEESGYVPLAPEKRTGH